MWQLFPLQMEGAVKNPAPHGHRREEEGFSGRAPVVVTVGSGRGAPANGQPVSVSRDFMKRGLKSRIFVL